MSDDDERLLALALTRMALDDGTRISFDDVLASAGLSRVVNGALTELIND